MRQAQAFSGIVIGGAVALLATQPSLAATTQVTAVRLDNSGGELQLTLETKGAERPQVFTVSRDNDLVADFVNTQLSLNQGDSFHQANPMPGISSVVVSQPDANSVRVTVSGTSRPPTSQVLQSNQDLITLGISTQAQPQTESSNPVTSSPNASVLPGTPDLPSLQAVHTEASPATSPTPITQTPSSQPFE
ncbi:MAG TPA: AMIN domain-containing protein, partial [Stenomitos sp.]